MISLGDPLQNVPGVTKQNLAQLEHGGVHSLASLIVLYLENGGNTQAMRVVLRDIGIEPKDANCIIAALCAKQDQMAEVAPLFSNDISMLPQLSYSLCIRMAALGLDRPCALLALAIKANLDEDLAFSDLLQLLMLCCTESLSSDDSVQELHDEDIVHVRLIAELAVQNCISAFKADDIRVGRIPTDHDKN